MCFFVLALCHAKAIAALAALRHRVGRPHSRNWGRSWRSDGRVTKLRGSRYESRVQPRIRGRDCAADSQHERRRVARRYVCAAISGKNIFIGNRGSCSASLAHAAIARAGVLGSVSRVAARRRFSRLRDSRQLAESRDPHSKHVCSSRRRRGSRATCGRWVFRTRYCFSPWSIPRTSSATGKKQSVSASNSRVFLLEQH